MNFIVIERRVMRKGILIFIIIIISCSVSFAGDKEMRSQCLAAEAGAKAGGLLGFTAGGSGGASIGTLVATGCAVTGWWTFGLGCAVSVVGGTIIGSVVGAKIGESAGELACD